MKILCIVQARMGSSRLPGKSLMNLADKPVIFHVLDNVNKSKYIDEILLATSSREKDDILEEKVVEYGYPVFRGEEENNVLKRYYDASNLYNGDIIVRITGDCPLINPIIIDNVITYFLMYDYDYVRLDVPYSFYRGLDVEVFSKKILNDIYYKVMENTALDYDKYREHVTLYIYENKDKYKVGYVKGEEKYNRDINLSLDTMEDYKNISGELYV